MRILLVISSLFVTVAANAADLPTGATGALPIRNLSVGKTAGTGVHIERIALPEGAEIITVFAPAPNRESETSNTPVPMVAFLRDTLGDKSTENDRVRQVWILTAGHTTLGRRALEAIPFVNLKSSSGNADEFPHAQTDLGAPMNDTWKQAARTVVQTQFFDPFGMAFRTSSRSYWWNSSTQADLHAYQASSVLSRVDTTNLSPELVDDLRRVQARILLSRRLLGGIARDQYLGVVQDHDDVQRVLEQAHNWEVLRQQAEKNGLYFEPISFGGGPPTHAMIWVRQSDLAKGHTYDKSLLRVSNPWTDKRLRGWKAYSETWRFDSVGHVLPDGDRGGVADDVIPLAFYSLQYPRVPLLLIDFRNINAPRRRDAVGHVAEDVTRGVFGMTPMGNWEYYAAKWVWDFVARRRGAASDRSARLREYAELNYILATDTSIREGLRVELTQKVPGGLVFQDDARVARLQYRWLTDVSADSQVVQLLNRDRENEQVALQHGNGARVGFQFARIASLGAYSHREPGPVSTSLLEVGRRVEWNMRTLERIFNDHGAADAPWNAAQIEQSVNELVALAPAYPKSDRISALFDRIAYRTRDLQVRQMCLHAAAGIRGRKPVVTASVPHPNQPVATVAAVPGFLTVADTSPVAYLPWRE